MGHLNVAPTFRPASRGIRCATEPRRNRHGVTKIHQGLRARWLTGLGCSVVNVTPCSFVLSVANVPVTFVAHQHQIGNSSATCSTVFTRLAMACASLAMVVYSS